MTNIDALIERLQRFAETGRGGALANDAAAALAELRDDDYKILQENMALREEIAKLRDVLGDCVAFMSDNIGGDAQKLGIMQEARAALGEPND